MVDPLTQKKLKSVTIARNVKNCFAPPPPDMCAKISAGLDEGAEQRVKRVRTPIGLSGNCKP